jgi:hypothetical protein
MRKMRRKLTCSRILELAWLCCSDIWRFRADRDRWNSRQKRLYKHHEDRIERTWGNDELQNYIVRSSGLTQNMRSKVLLADDEGRRRQEEEKLRENEEVALLEWVERVRKGYINADLDTYYLWIFPHLSV